MKKSFTKQVIDCLWNKQGMKTSIMARFLRLSLISVVVVVAVMVAFCLYYSSDVIDGAYEDQLANDSKATATAVEMWVKLVKTELEAQASNSAFVDESLTLEARKALLAEAAAQTEFKDLSIAYADGSTYNSTDISDRDYFKNAMNGVTYVSSPVLRKTDNSITIMAGTKMSVDGFDGVIYGALDVSFFENQLGMLNLGEQGFGLIIDSEGKVIAYDVEDNDYVVNQINPITQAAEDDTFAGFAELTADMLANAEGTMTVTMPDGVVYRASYMRADGDESWTVAVLMSDEEVSAGYNKMARLAVNIGVILLFISFDVNLLVATKIAYPVRVAANRLQALSDGDINGEREEVHINADETGRLLTSFDETRAMLQEYIGDIGEVLKNITDGNLDVRVTKDYKGDFAQIKDNLNRILDALNATFTLSGETASNLMEGARQVEMASQSLAEASTIQAQSVVEITSSIDGIARSTADNAQDVIRVNELTQNAKTEADNGDAQMSRMIDAMSEISQSSESIAKIMKVIDDIAFQTNILALNASVEAARAGSHGRGFAVVAEEVRNLAGKSATAAGEISEMIENSLSKIKIGSAIAEETAGDLKKIVAEIDEIAGIMNRIADASSDQASAVEQVNHGIVQISEAVQNNSATSEECAASSVELSRQSKALAGQIAYYHVRRDF